MGQAKGAEKGWVRAKGVRGQRRGQLYGVKARGHARGGKSCSLRPKLIPVVHLGRQLVQQLSWVKAAWGQLVLAHHLLLLAKAIQVLRCCVWSRSVEEASGVEWAGS